MNERKLSNQQIESLFDFCKKQKVKYYDLQIELVDHLAAGIEEELKNNETISFSDALHNQFNQFGISGFKAIKKEKNKALREKYTHVLWSLFREFYTLPKVLLTFALTFILFFAAKLTPNSMDFIVVIFITYGLIHMLLFNFIANKRFRISYISNKKFLALHQLMIFKIILYYIAAIPIYLFVCYTIFQPEIPVNLINSFAIEIIISFLFVSYCILIFVSFYHIPKHIKQDFESKFSQFVKA
jgi:hypothetical protein